MAKTVRQPPPSQREGFWRPENDPVRAREQLLKRRLSWDKKPPQEITAAIYAFYLRERSTLPPIVCDETRLLYVGMTESCLEIRDHFEHENSGFSTLRRTLGALLKSALRLKAIPRSAGPSKTNVRNFRFRDSDEKKLTEWMRDHLVYSYVAVEGDVRGVERNVIAALRPPLNLTGCRNPYQSELRVRRKDCRLEAEKHCSQP